MHVRWKFIIRSTITPIPNLNAAAAGTDMEGKTIENILINLDMKILLFVTTVEDFTIIIF
jgi:hypothetical protein